MTTQANYLLNSLFERSKVLHSNINGCRLVWREWGYQNVGRQPIVLLHGGSGAWNHWVRNIPVLEKGFHILALDLPGCGDSSDPPKPYDAESLATIVSSSIDEVLESYSSFDLIAFSFGGFLSGLIAHLQKRRINRLTLIGSPILGLTGIGPANELVEVPKEISETEAVPLYLHNLRKLMVFKPESADDLALEIHVENMAKARLRSRGIARTSILAESLKNLPCPLHCIFGEKDTTLHPDLAGVKKYVEDIHPGASFYIIEDAGHWVQFEAYEKVNSILQEILNED